MIHSVTNLMQREALDHHSFRTIISHGQRATVSQQVSNLFIVNLQTSDVRDYKQGEIHESIVSETVKIKVSVQVKILVGERAETEMFAKIYRV